MSKVNHSKIKNTGLIYEMLVRQITNETLSNNNSKALDLLKKYYTKTEIAKENRLYQTLLQYSNLNESKANIVIDTISNISQKLNREKLQNEKYNLIKEIKANYDINNFFKTSIPNYKELASIYIILESTFQNSPNPDIVISSKNTILEYVTRNLEESNSEIYNYLSGVEKGERYLIYKMMVEDFNKRYSSLHPSQKEILKEYIFNFNDSEDFRLKLNNAFKEVKYNLLENKNKIDDKILDIKIDEVVKMINPILESKKIKDEHIISLLQYQELNQEIISL